MNWKTIILLWYYLAFLAFDLLGGAFVFFMSASGTNKDSSTPWLLILICFANLLILNLFLIERILKGSGKKVPLYLRIIKILLIGIALFPFFYMMIEPFMRAWSIDATYMKALLLTLFGTVGIALKLIKFG